MSVSTRLLGLAATAVLALGGVFAASAANADPGPRSGLT